jgi:hypothetical protein
VCQSQSLKPEATVKPQVVAKALSFEEDDQKLEQMVKNQLDHLVKDLKADAQFKISDKREESFE